MFAFGPFVSYCLVLVPPSNPLPPPLKPPARHSICHLEQKTTSQAEKPHNPGPEGKGRRGKWWPSRVATIKSRKEPKIGDFLSEAMACIWSYVSLASMDLLRLVGPKTQPIGSGLTSSARLACLPAIELTLWQPLWIHIGCQSSKEGPP